MSTAIGTPAACTPQGFNRAIVSANEKASHRFEGMQGGRHAILDAISGAAGFALEGGACLVGVELDHDADARTHQQHRHHQRQCHRPAARSPHIARLADQAQQHRGEDQHAQGVADPPGGPVQRGLLEIKPPRGPQRGQADAGADAIRQQATQAVETPQLPRLG